jgi:hypothetical protein
LVETKINLKIGSGGVEGTGGGLSQSDACQIDRGWHVLEDNKREVWEQKISDIPLYEIRLQMAQQSENHEICKG